MKVNPGLLLLLVGLLAKTAVAQTDTMVSIRKANYGDKQDLLMTLWQKPVNWFPGSNRQVNYDQIQLDLSDSNFHKGIGFLDTLMFMYVNLYYRLVMIQESHLPDSISGVFFNLADTTKAAYSIDYSVEDIKKNPPGAFALCNYLVYFSPFAGAVFKQPGELIVYLKYYGTIDKVFMPLYRDYVSKMACVMGKYFLNDDKEFNRLLIMWEDPHGNIVHHLYFPKTKDFRVFARFM